MPEHTIAENLTRLQNATAAISNAITAKGGTVGANDGLEDFAADIASIPSGGVEFSNTPANFSLLDNIRNLDVIIPSGVTAMQQKAFYNCVGLRSLIMPNTIQDIGKQCMQDCINLESVQMSNELLYIKENGFYGCTKLKNIEIPNTVTKIYNRAFMNCTTLESIKFYNSTPILIDYTEVWYNIPTTCKIYVPTGSLTAYTSAANYPDPNTYTYEEY